MKYDIDFNQPSTIRGAVWLATGVLSTIGYFIGLDVTPMILIGTSVAGGLGVTIKD